MINIVVCDDEKVILQRLCSYVEEVFREAKTEYKLQAFQQPLELLQALKCEKIDILLLDIDLPGTNGMDIASQLKYLSHPPLLIFVTYHESLVYESFQYQPFDFIRKSCYEMDLRATLQRGIAQLANKKADYILEQLDGIIRLPLREILYFESCANYIKVVTEKDVYQQRKNMHQAESELSTYGFVRIHKGFLVNQEVVHILKSDRVILTNQEELPIGRHYRNTAREAILGHLRG